MILPPPPADPTPDEVIVLVLVPGPDPVAARHGLHERPLGVRWRKCLKALKREGFTCVRNRSPTAAEMAPVASKPKET